MLIRVHAPGRFTILQTANEIQLICFTGIAAPRRVAVVSPTVHRRRASRTDNVVASKRTLDMRTRPGRPSVSKVDQPLAFPAHCIARTLVVTGCHFGEPEVGAHTTGLIPNVDVVWDDERGDGFVAASVLDVLK